MTLHSVLIQKLHSTNAHLRRRVATQHFKLYDSDKTLICPPRPASLPHSLVRHNPNPRFMFINTNPLFDEIVDGEYRLLLTFHDLNLDSRRIPNQQQQPEEVPVEELEAFIFVIDTERKSSVLVEAEKLQIQVVALVDSSMPLESFRRITYPVRPCE